MLIFRHKSTEKMVSDRTEETRKGENTTLPTAEEVIEKINELLKGTNFNPYNVDNGEDDVLEFEEDAKWISMSEDEMKKLYNKLVTYENLIDVDNIPEYEISSLVFEIFRKREDDLIHEMILKIFFEWKEREISITRIYRLIPSSS